MKKYFYLISILFFIFLLNISLSQAYFTRTHEYWSLKGMRDVNSPITQECRPYLKELIDGNTLADVPVLFYFSSDKQTSYIFTHQNGAGYRQCLEEAGSDVKLRCVCQGVGTHIVQDFYSHTLEGVVPKYLRQFASANFIGHMVVERNFEDLFISLKSNEQVVTSGELDRIDNTALDSAVEELGGDARILDLLDRMAGIPMGNSFKIFRSGYQGEGFFNTVYKDKVRLPFWALGLSIGLMILGLAVSVTLMLYGKTNWKWLAALIWFIFFIIGAIILISFLTGTTWKITGFLITVPPKFGYLRVSQIDIIEYDLKVQEATNKFLQTGVLPFEDASGLTYIDKEGKEIRGALKQAEGTFKFIVFPISLLSFLITNIWLFRRSFGFYRRK